MILGAAILIVAALFLAALMLSRVGESHHPRCDCGQCEMERIKRTIKIVPRKGTTKPKGGK